MNSDEITSLFLPHILEKMARLRQGKRLVHYTSAEAAYRIITGRQVWLRNAQVMNDFSEIQHGINCLSQAWKSPSGLLLQAMLERIRAGLPGDLATLFNAHADVFRQGTFITSLSEHEDSEDKYGRPSMWRAYGGRSGVALVLNNSAFITETAEMHVFSSPVFYRDPESFVEWFQTWANSITAAEAKLKDLGADELRNWLFTAFRSFALCTKHPAFEEEREWRVFYSPAYEGNSDWITESTEVVRGVPQKLMKLDLRDEPEKGINGVAPQKLINRVIIGPCEYPLQIREAISNALEKLDMINPGKIIWMSLIPFRH